MEGSAPFHGSCGSYSSRQGGFLLLSFVLWLLMFVTDTIRHAIARAGSRYRHV